MKTITVAIVGFGRFGKTLYRMIKDDFSVIVYDRSRLAQSDYPTHRNTKIVDSAKEAYRADVIFYAVPIENFESVIKSHRRFFRPNHLLIDVLSVKELPQRVFNQCLKGLRTQALLTHPMFGPDSTQNGFKGLNLMVNQFRCNDDNFQFWRRYFKNKGITVVEMSAKEHDRLAAQSQGVTHFVGRLLEGINFRPTPIDTLGAKKLQEIMRQTCNDNKRLFNNLQTFNFYTKAMRLAIGRAYDRLYNRLLPKRVDKGWVVIGIQGGRGSFNEQAAFDYLQRHQIRQYRIKYLYTSDRVLRHLHAGKIDYGLFAIHNALGGIVWESARSMAQYKFKIVEEFPILIKHTLMKRKDVGIDQIKTVIAHPQVFLQCRKHLAVRHPHLRQTSGKGDLIDTARSAKAVVSGEIDKRAFVLGPGPLAKLYNLEVVDRDLQDSNNNLTYFFLVSR
ncbi:prephenate dehydrogenase/arogenate dehydrogenase family protein [Patescibacteria group bacterium]|nr:prephenate dehydrogenase/arogenate dehydrogenase family protein [Patescibacteria group bacterium]MCL5091584.1 prephenate dehydrogenase/arogenate dehydrogenase family protein [Patescibacteria group bacterium]